MDVSDFIYSSPSARSTSNDQSMLHDHISISRTRNSRVPAARLAPELLSFIFFWCLPTSTFQIHDCVLPTQVVATHVCHRWREIGLQSAVLWSRIDLERMRMAQAFLGRSKQARLNVRIAIRNDPGNGDQECKCSPDTVTACDAFQILHHHSDRICTLMISGLKDDWDDVDEKLTTARTTFPNLQNLDASVICDDDDLADLGPVTIKALIQKRRRPAQISLLKLNLCMLDLSAIDCSCMTSLHLTCWEPFTIEQTQWRELLVSAQRLAALYIGNIQAVPTLEEGALIRFTHLRSVHLYGPLHTCARLLNNICVPEDARIMAEEVWMPAELRDNLEAHEAQHMFTRFLSRHLAKISYNTSFEIRYLPGDLDGNHCISLLTTGRGYFRITTMDTSLQVNLTWMLDQFPEHALRHLVETCSIAGAPSTNTWFTSSGAWTQLCERMPSISCVHVDSTTVEICLQHANFPAIQELNIWYDDGPSDAGPSKDQLFQFWARQPHRNRFKCIQLDAALDVEWSHVHPTQNWPVHINFESHTQRPIHQFILVDV
jgi:hypothetical protein